MFDDRKNNLELDDKPAGTGKSRKGAHLFLFGLSALSALVILSCWLIISWGQANGYAEGGGEGMIAPLLWMLAAQWLLVIPATGFVFLVYRRLSRRGQLHEINPIAGVAIPLLFNILAASSLFILAWISPWYYDTSDFLLSRNLTLTIKTESVEPAGSQFGYPHYVAVLHAENKTGQEILLNANLGDYTTRAYQEFDWDHVLGDSSPITIPPGASDIKVDLPFNFACDKTPLTKPIHLLYWLLGNRYQGSLDVSNTITQRLQELGCGAAP